MHKLVTGMHNKKGFTLIEILVVIVIIGVTLGFALIAFGDFGEGRRILVSAEQLINTLKLAQQQAILETNTLGLRVDQTSYQILKFQDQWVPLSNKNVFKLTTFPKNTIVTLNTQTNVPPGTPSIIINASGDMTAFTLTLGTLKEPTIAKIIGYSNGGLLLSTGQKL